MRVNYLNLRLTLRTPARDILDCRDGSSVGKRSRRKENLAED